MHITDKIDIREVSPRDGFQSLAGFIPTDHKLHIIDLLVRAGVKEIEATSFVSPKAVPQLKDAAELMSRLPRQDIVRAALVANLRGAQDAVAAGVDQLVMVISASEAHNRANVRCSIAQSVKNLDAIFPVARENGVVVNGAIAVAFGCPYQGDVPEGDVSSLVQEFYERGASSVILADTTGMASPRRIDGMVRTFIHGFPGCRFTLHLHNNRGTAMANLLAGLLAGARSFDTALGGIGGCPNVPLAAGNLATEDVVFMLEDMGVETGIDLEKIIQAAVELEKVVGFTLPGQVMKSGPRLARVMAGLEPCYSSRRRAGR